MSRPNSIASCLESEDRLLDRLGSLDDATAQQPSLLPDWTVGHLVTHLARNADSVTRRLDGAADGIVVPQYEGGAEARAAAIEEGADRPAAELLADLRASVNALRDAFGRVPDEAWDHPVGSLGGPGLLARDLPFGRRREVEIHHVDLGLGYTPADWPPDLVHALLPKLLEGVVGRTDPSLLAAWLLSRADAPELRAWDN